MRTAICLLGFGLAASGCDAKLPAATFTLEASQLPKGAELVVDGKVVATREGSTVEVAMGEGESLVAGKSVVRIATVCGSVERPFALKRAMSTENMTPEDEQNERAKKGPVKVSLVVDELPRTQTVWVDAVDGQIAVGEQSLSPGEHALFVDGCDDAQRTVTVAGKPIGPLTEFDLTKHHPSLVLTADKQACYDWQPVVYSQGGFMPNLHETKRLTGAHIHEVKFIHFFLAPPSETVLGAAGSTETRYRLDKVSCDAVDPIKPEAESGK